MNTFALRLFKLLTYSFMLSKLFQRNFKLFQSKNRIFIFFSEISNNYNKLVSGTMFYLTKPTFYFIAFKLNGKNLLTDNIMILSFIHNIKVMHKRRMIYTIKNN